MATAREHIDARKPITEEAEVAGAVRPDSVIFLEFNELCPHLLDKWMAAGHLPNFRRLYRQSAVFGTKPDVDEQVNLEPWIQWYSIHTGLAFDQHGVFHLTEGRDRDHDDLYRILMRTGRRVASFASMNVRAFDGDGSVYVPDPWCEDANASPAALNTYARFVSRQVREYSNPESRNAAAEAARFVAFCLGHGLAPDTIWRIAAQLASERFSDRRLSFRRAALLDRLQFDIFRHYYLRKRPAFATFFINSTAHLQHSYWRHMEPEHFDVRPGGEEAALYRDAILFGYRAMDGLIGKFLALAEKTGAMLMFMTALSQQPFLKYESAGGQKFYRLRDIDAFLRRLGIAYREASPVMTHQYLLRFDDTGDRERARSRLEKLSVNGRRVFHFSDHESGGLYFGSQIATEQDADARLVDGVDGSERPFLDDFYLTDGIKSAFHHPDGALWVQTRRHKIHPDKVSILDIFPTTLDLLGMEAPAREPGRRGKSLIADL